jgi:hypothetical protein
MSNWTADQISDRVGSLAIVTDARSSRWRLRTLATRSDRGSCPSSVQPLLPHPHTNQVLTFGRVRPAAGHTALWEEG